LGTAGEAITETEYAMRELLLEENFTDQVDLVWPNMSGFALS
jgi:hypothetical protein